MALNKTIIQQTPPSLASQQPNVSFDKNKFENLIQNMGYDIIHEKAIACPCKNEETGSHALSSCSNCGGIGWVFYNPTRTRMILHSMNKDTEFREWSETKIGTSSVTAMDRDRLGFMDRLTLNDAESIHTEVLYPKLIGSELYTFTIYPIVSVEVAFRFSTDDTALVKLEETTDYTISNNVFSLTNVALIGSQISIRYIHRPQWHIIDLPRDSMNSPVKNRQTGAKEDLIFPIHAIARRVHYVSDAENKTGSRLIDNSFDVSC